MTDIDIITAEAESGVTDGDLNPRDISMSDSTGTTWTTVGTFAAETVASTAPVAFATPTKGNKVRLTAHVVAESGANKATSTMKFCGFKAYGTKTPIQGLLDAQTTLVSA